LKKTLQALIPAASLLLLLNPSCSRLSAGPDIVGSIVKVFSESYGYNYQAPWQLDSAESATGSACIIAGNRILTNAHVVANAKFIQVKRAGAKDKVEAEVEIVAHECDLAVLKVKDRSFFEGARALDVGPLVDLRDRVTVYGFPEGGEELSTTEGIVSRVEVNSYAHSGARLLCGQIDAAINAGNSGGPVVKDGRIVGVAFQAGRGENISYMVPAPVIRHFLKDVEDGRYDGIPSLEISTQELENPDLRAKHGMAAGQSGVLVISVYPRSPAEGVLRPGDIIMSVEQKDVASDGTVEFRRNERTVFSERVQEFFIGDTIRLGVLRDGKPVTLAVKLTVPVNATRLVPRSQYDVQPSYVIVGGLVFQRLTANYLELWEKGEAPPDLLNEYYYGEPTKDRRSVIILSSVLADEINIGYQDMSDAVIVRANGRPLSTLPDLVAAVAANTGPFHVFVDDHGKEIVIGREKAAARGELILKRYKIDADRSADLRTP
jgi:S1-C subfamily serine protease